MDSYYSSCSHDLKFISTNDFEINARIKQFSLKTNEKNKICADDDINVIEPNAIQYTHVVFFVVIARDQGGGQNFNFTNEMFSSYSFAVPYCLLLIVNKKKKSQKKCEFDPPLWIDVE